MTTKKRSKRQSRRRLRGPGSPPRRNSSPFESPARTGGLVRQSEASVQTTPAVRNEGTERFPDEVNALAEALSESLANEHPLLFLLLVSQLYPCFDRPTPDDPARIDLAAGLSALAQCDLAGFRAAGYALSRMVSLDHERASFDEVYSQGPSELPEWLRELDSAEIAGCWRGYRDDEADTVVGIGIRFAGGREGTLVVITCDDTGEILDAYVSFDPYAETALTWATHDSTATGLSKISGRSARMELAQAMENTDPRSHEAPDGRADWVYGRAIMEWAASMLVHTP